MSRLDQMRLVFGQIYAIALKLLIQFTVATNPAVAGSFFYAENQIIFERTSAALSLKISAVPASMCFQNLSFRHNEAIVIVNFCVNKSHLSGYGHHSQYHGHTSIHLTGLLQG